jgi:hypothetical protein
MRGFLQSWKYFEHEFDELRNKEFVFVKRYSQPCLHTVRALSFAVVNNGSPEQTFQCALQF